MENKDLTTLFTGRHCIFFDTIDSTNSWLSRVADEKSLPEGSAVRALYQEKGRGQNEAFWHSEAGMNMLQSFIFYPTFLPPKDVFKLNKAFTLGVFDFVSEILGDRTSIKWPNDIYFGNKKIAGLLIENSINGPRIISTILGIGINVNQTDFPDLLNATSFSIVKHREFDTDRLFYSLCSKLESRYLSLKRGEHSKTDKDYMSVLYGLGESKRFLSSDKAFEGIIMGVDENGRLVMELSNGRQERFGIKEISFI